MVMLLLSIALQIATLHCPLVPPDCITQAGDDVLAAAHITCAAPPYGREDSPALPTALLPAGFLCQPTKSLKKLHKARYI